ncbi:MAG: hypothetical protein ROO76_14445 [Terriglobia bacterium]|nr:hypothetical protein [Terriglobia bacterium]
MITPWMTLVGSKWIPDSLREGVDRKAHESDEQGGTGSYQHVSSQPGGASLPLALPPNGSRQNGSNDEPSCYPEILVPVREQTAQCVFHN